MTQAHNPHRQHHHAVALWTSEYPNDPISLPYVRAELATLNGETDAPRRASRWIDALHRYEEFAQAEGHTPRENTRDRSTLLPGESNLGEWARYQRRFEDTLCGYQIVRLNVSSAFVWDLREDQWMRTLRECTAFTTDHQRLPYLNSADPREFALARWLRRQLHQQHAGTAAPARVVHIGALLDRANTRES